MNLSGKACCLALLILWGGGMAWALEASPTGFLLSGRPGKRLKCELVLRNDAEKPVRIFLEAASESAPGVPSPNEGDKKNRGPAPKDPSGPDWLSWPRESFILPGGSDKKVTIRARVPRGGGERNAAFVIRGVVGPETYEYRIVRRITLRVEGTEKPEAVLEDVRVIELPGAQAGLSALFRNVGNISLRPRFVLESVGGVKSVLSGEDPLVAPGRSVAVHWDLASPGSPAEVPGKLHAFYQGAGGEALSVQADVRGEGVDAP